MTSEEIINLIKTNCANLDDLKKIISACESELEAVQEDAMSWEPEDQFLDSQYEARFEMEDYFSEM